MDTAVPFLMRCVPLAVALLYAPFTYWLARGGTALTLRAYRRALRLAPTLHWTERARLSMGARRFSSLTLYALPIQALVLTTYSVGTLAWGSVSLVSAVAAVACFFGAYLAARRLGIELGFERQSLLYDLRATFFGLHAIVGVIAAVYGAWGLGHLIVSWKNAESTPGSLAALLGVPIALALLWGPVQVPVFRCLGIYRHASTLAPSLEPVFNATGVRPRAVWLVATSWANASAFPLRRTITVTEGALSKLTFEQLAAIVAHELGHLEERYRAWWRLTLLWFLCAVSFGLPFLDADDIVVFVSAAIVVTVLMARALRAWSRQRERDADRVAFTVADPIVYARALEKLYEAHLYPATQRGGTHPALYDRLTSAGIQPNYPRPALPPQKFAVMVIGLFVFAGATVLWPHAWRAASGNSAAVAAVITRNAHPLGRLALAAWGAGDVNAAIALYQRAEELDAQSPWYPRNLAAVLNEAGDCRGARSALERARANAHHDPEIRASLFTLDCQE